MPAARKLDGQAVEALDGDVGDIPAALLQQGHPLFDGEEGVLGAVDQHRHDQVIVDPGRPLNDVEVAPGDRVEGTGIDGDGHEITDLSAQRPAPQKGPHRAEIQAALPAARLAGLCQLRYYSFTILLRFCQSLICENCIDKSL